MINYFQPTDETLLHFLVLPVQIFTARPCHTMYTESNHPHSFHILSIKRKFHSDRFFLIMSTLGNKLLRRCFSDHNNFNLFKYRASYYLSYISSKYALTSSSYIHTISSLSNTLPWVALGPCVGWTFSQEKKKIFLIRFECHHRQLIKIKQVFV